jgi:hypothetical protein
MADKWYTAASGNWSTAANWNDGTKPVAGDDVYADGKTITVDEDFSVRSINTTQRSGGTTGGTFQITTLASGTRALTCNVVAGSDNCLRVTGGTAGATISVTGNVTGSSSARGIWWTGGSCHLTVTGNLQGGAVSPGHAIQFLSVSPGTVTITGTVTAGAGGNGILGGPTTLVINGDVYGSTAAGISISTTTTTTTINGICYSSNNSSDFAGFAISSNSQNNTTVSEVVSRGSGVMPISGRNFRFKTTGTRRFTVIDTAGSSLALEPTGGSSGIPIARGMHGGMR